MAADADPAEEAEAAVAEDAPEAAAPAEAPVDPLALLTSAARHVVNFAPSGIVDLSERSLRTAYELEIFGEDIIKAEVAAAVWSLDLCKNHLASVPATMTRPLCGLRELDLSRNSLACFPVALCHLPSLELLDMSLNLLESVDVSAELVKSGLPKLQKLLLSRNRLTAFPQCLPGCMQLEALDLSHNRLGFAMTGSDAADPLRGTAKLRELCLNDNGLLQVPPAVFALPLEVLRVGGNRLSALPPSIAGLAGSLTSLDIGRNSLSALPPQLGTCDLLSQLAVDANPLTWPPADVMKKPLPKILAWLREQLRMPAPPPVDRAALAAAAAKAARESLIAALRAEALAVRSCLTKRSAELAELQARCAGAVAALSECEAATTAASRLLEAERASTMERMELEQKGVADAAARVASIPKRHLEELRQLNNPPKTVMRTLQAVHLLLDAAENPASGSRLRQAVEAVQAAASPPASAVAKLRIAAQRVSAGAKVAPAPKVVGGVTTAGGDKAAWETVRGTLQRNFVS